MHFTYYLTLTFAQNFGYLVIFINPYVTFSIAVYHHLFIYLFKLWFLFFSIFDSLFWCRNVTSNWTYFGLELLLLTARSDIIGAELVDRIFQILLIYLIFFLFPIIRIIISSKYSQSSIAIFLCIT